MNVEWRHVVDVLHFYELSRIINIDSSYDHFNVNDEVVDVDEDEVGDRTDRDIHVADIVFVEVKHIDVMVDDDLLI